MLVKEMIEKYLKDNQYDGLFNEDADCACELSDLMPCDNVEVDHCEAGYKKPCDCGEYDWYICRDKPEPSPEDKDK